MIYAFILNEVMTARMLAKWGQERRQRQRQAGRQTNKPLPDKTDCQAIRAKHKHAHRDREREREGNGARVQANTLSSCGRG